MAKLGFFVSTATIVIALVFATMRISGAADDGPCHHTEFRSEILVKACTGKDGNQKAAHAAMSAFMKQAKIKSCNQCHVKLAPDYPNKPDAYEQFEKAGGKLVAKPVPNPFKKP